MPDAPLQLPPDLAQALARLAQHKDRWARTGLEERARLIGECLPRVGAVASDWVRLACERKGIRFESQLAGEEWLSGPMLTLRAMRLLRAALLAGGAPTPLSLDHRPDGRWVARVFPAQRLERLIYLGMRGEVWGQPDTAPTQGGSLRAPDRRGRVGVVLGAGNILSIAPTDVLYKLMVESQVVLLKLHPFWVAFQPLLERALQPLLDAGCLAIVSCDPPATRALLAHPEVEACHLTGSGATFDRIVWGEEAERTRRREAGDPVWTGQITAELGCVTPILVVPGIWSRSDVERQAQHVAAMVAHNASFNCVAAQVVVTARGWPLREAFLHYLRRALKSTPPRRAWYPGSLDRYESWLATRPRAEVWGAREPEGIPWTLVADLAPNSGDPLFQEEVFCGVVAEVAVSATTTEDFLRVGVDFCNDRLAGTLSCVVLDKEMHKQQPQRFEQALAELRYGSIGINLWTGMSFGIAETSWGAYPGHDIARPGSGLGVVHNAFLFDHPEKSILRAPFLLWPKPVYSPDHRQLAAVARRMLQYELDPGWRHLPGLIALSLRA